MFFHIKRSYFIIVTLVIVIVGFNTIRKLPKASVISKQIVSVDNRTLNKLKTILLWNKHYHAPFHDLGAGQEAFLRLKCPVNNCYVTKDKELFGGDETKFDAISFAGQKLTSDRYSLPIFRSPHQKYIFYEMESAENYPVCDQMYDGFFNWTATYKLNSDILQNYILIKNTNNEIVGPKNDMKWIKDMHKVDERLSRRFQNKSKAAAWFVSNCNSKSRREIYVEKLADALKMYNLTVDVYGACGPLKCPKENMAACLAMLKNDYYFYMALENSFSEDYLTEKVLTALQNDAVPVVYSGANYSRFLPPGSYINAMAYKHEELAALMNKLIKSPELYHEYFRWTYHYTYHDAKSRDNVCNICATLNNRNLMETITVYENFGEWWNPYYVFRCQD